MINHVITLLKNDHVATLPPIGELGESYTDPAFTPLQLSGTLAELRAKLIPSTDPALKNTYARICDTVARADMRNFRRYYPDRRVVYAPLVTFDIDKNFILNTIEWADDSLNQALTSLFGSMADLRTSWEAKEFPVFRFSSLVYLTVLRMGEQLERQTHG